MFINGFEIRQGPRRFVDCVAWDGTVMNTFRSACEAIEWAQQETAPKLDAAAKAELDGLSTQIGVAG